jgi:hypothetical protein
MRSVPGDPWGVKVLTVEVKHVDTMTRAMARQVAQPPGRLEFALVYSRVVDPMRAVPQIYGYRCGRAHARSGRSANAGGAPKA